MIKIGVVTTTRAEYGLLAPVVRELRKREDQDFHVELIVSGTHLSKEYGMTIEEIVASGTRIDHKIPIPVKSESELDISNNQADALVKFTRLFLKNHQFWKIYQFLFCRKQLQTFWISLRDI